MNLDAQWRADITRRLEEMAKVQQDTAVIQERMLGKINGLERWQQDMDERREKQEDRRETRYEQAPAATRSVIGTYGGCAGQVVFAVLSFLGVCLSIAALIITLTR